MGKGTIQGGGIAGRYTVRLDRDEKRIDARITAIDKEYTDIGSRITTINATDMPAAQAALITAGGALDAAIAAYNALPLDKRSPSTLEAPTIAYKSAEDKVKALQREIDTGRLKQQALQVEKAQLQKLKAPVDLEAWCADYTEDLTGSVATIEVAGDRRHGVLIRPGYSGRAVYDLARDRRLQLPLAGGPNGTFYNRAAIPGWQKWRPNYRLGTITTKSGNTCSVDLDPAISNEQSLNINQATSLSGVTIEYMTCDGAAFVVGDRVVVEFPSRRWETPKVIGFASGARPCQAWRETFAGIEWDFGTSNDPTTWPAGAKQASGPYAPITGSITAITSPDYYQFAMFYQDAAHPGSAMNHCGVTKDGHKIFWNPNTSIVTVNNGLTVTTSNPDYWPSITTLVPGDAVNLKMQDGTATGDFAIPTTWKRLEIDLDVTPSTDGTFGLSIFLMMSSGYEFGYLYSGHPAAAGPFTSNLQDGFCLGHIGRSDPSLDPPGGLAFPGVYRSLACTYDATQHINYRAGYYFERTNSQGVSRFILDRRELPSVSAPDTIHSIIFRGAQVQAFTVRSISFFY